MASSEKFSGPETVPSLTYEWIKGNLISPEEYYYTKYLDDTAKENTSDGHFVGDVYETNVRKGGMPVHVFDRYAKDRGITPYCRVEFAENATTFKKQYTQILSERKSKLLHLLREEGVELPAAPDRMVLIVKDTQGKRYLFDYESASFSEAPHCQLIEEGVLIAGKRNYRVGDIFRDYILDGNVHSTVSGSVVGVDIKDGLPVITIREVETQNNYKYTHSLAGYWTPLENYTYIDLTMRG